MYLFWQRERWNPVRHQNHIGIKDSNLLAHRLESNGICGIYLFNITWKEFHKHDVPTLFVQLLCQQNPSWVLLKGDKRETITKNAPLFRRPPLSEQFSPCSRGRERREALESRDGRGFESNRCGFVFSPTMYPGIDLSQAAFPLCSSYFISKGRTGVLWGFTLTELK